MEADISGPTTSTSWHALPSREVLSRFETRESGLSSPEAARRLLLHGPNALFVKPPVSPWRILLDQLRSLIILLLVVATGVAVLLGDHLEAAAIATVLLVTVAIGFGVEWRARRAVEALSRMQLQSALVLRDGTRRTVDARELVPGDVIVLEAGTAVPADARLLSATELRVVEAPLTGESAPVGKTAEPVEAEGVPIPLGDRISMVFKGTVTAAGVGTGVVVATGAATEIGIISELVQQTRDEKTPLEERLDVLGRRLIWITLGVTALIVLLGMFRGEEIWLMAKTGLALAIAAIPEGLPVVATVTLALGMRRMARRHALVRRLPAVETLGSATVICTDKTGTLTEGQMMVTRLVVGGGTVVVTGHGFAPAGELLRDGAVVEPGGVAGLEEALRIGVLVNRARLNVAGPGGEGRDGEAAAAGAGRARGTRRAEDVPVPAGPTVEGDPTEGALLVLGRKAGLVREHLLQGHPEVAEVPFSSERMWMATFHASGGEGGVVTALVKGAPDRLVGASGTLLGPEGPLPLDAAGRARLLDVNRELAGGGLRVLALARRELAPGEAPGEDAVRDLTFVGFVGMIDPPAPGVKETIERLRMAGIRTVMITGDQADTAEAVARELGVLGHGPQGSMLDGAELTALADEELPDAVATVSGFSRVSPADKLRIVRAFQERGEIVGMLGDGVNDAPALKRADIGVAMGGRGTDVARETADLILQDDRFETVGAAVEEGRVIYDNIRKYIFFLFSCNLSEVLVVFVAGAVGLPLPLLPLQILWLNLVTDVFPALALAVEPAEPDVMRRPPRDPRAAILSRGFMIQVGGYAVLMTGATLGVFVWGLEGRGLPGEHAVTLAFMTLALTQLFHVFNARGEDAILLTRRFFRNGWVWGAVVLTLGLQLLAVYLPVLSDVLRTDALGAADWGMVLGASLVPLLVGQMWKAGGALRTSSGH